MVGYSYSQENRIDFPHYYMYTPYQGSAFLKAYFQDRLRIAGPYANHSVSALQEKSVQIAQDRIEDIQPDGSIHHVERYFMRVNRNIIEGLNDHDNYKILSRFIQKYEVTKKIYDKYDSRMKGEGSFHKIEPYVWFHMACLNYYLTFGNLKMLNCGLKIGDLISSVVDESKAIHIVRISQALEIRAIQKLVKKHGLSV